MKIDYKKIADEYNTPMYVYDMAIFKEQYDKLKESIIPGAEIYYSMKANPLLGICQLFYKMGSGIEVASSGEIQTALKAGCPANKIIFTSPGKTYEEISVAIKNNIETISIESMEEAHIINRIASMENKVVKIAVRINPNINNVNSKIKMTGVSSQFGIDEQKIDEVFFNELSKLENVSMVGIQVYMGTQNLNSTDIVYNTEYIIQLAIRLSQEFNFDLNYINMGGGFGIPYFEKETELDLVELKKGMYRIYKQYENELKSKKLIFESGRFLTAKAGKFITKVLYKKNSRDINYIVCDGGSSFHASSAFLGRFVRNNFPIFTIPESQETERVNIVGPLCTPSDIIGQQVDINVNIKSGDLVVIDKSGAYGLTHSPLRFLSHNTPVEIMVNNGETSVLRERGKAIDVLMGQNSLTV